MSLNAWDPATGEWTQDWVDNTGMRAIMRGKFVGRNLIYQREFTSREGKPMLSRMTFMNQDSKSVRQVVEQSGDGGKTWTVQYDLRYSRVSGS
jgi:hypothetical protein